MTVLSCFFFLSICCLSFILGSVFFLPPKFFFDVMIFLRLEYKCAVSKTETPINIVLFQFQFCYRCLFRYTSLSFTFLLILFPALRNLLTQKITIEGKNVDIEEYSPSFITGLLLSTSPSLLRFQNSCSKCDNVSFE